MRFTIGQPVIVTFTVEKPRSFETVRNPAVIERVPEYISGEPSDVYGVRERLGPGLNNYRVYGDRYARCLRAVETTNDYLPVLEAQDHIAELTRRARDVPAEFRASAMQQIAEAKAQQQKHRRVYEHHCPTSARYAPGIFGPNQRAVST